MGDISFAVDILKEDAPSVNIEVHLNTTYFFLNFPNSDSSIDDIFRVNVSIVEYGSTSEGDKDLENIISELEVEFDPARSIYAVISEDLPKHHAFHNIKNSWYTFKFTYMYLGGTSEEGNLISYSKFSEYDIDNTVPVIYEKYISKYMRNSLVDQLDRDGQIKLWWDNIIVSNPQPYQAIKFLGAPGIREINIIYPSTTNIVPENVFTNIPLNSYYQEFLNKLLNDSSFHDTVLQFFVSGVPVSGLLRMRFEYNRRTYFFIIEGNLENLAREYFK